MAEMTVPPATAENAGYNGDEPRVGLIALFAFLSIATLVGVMLFLQVYLDKSRQVQLHNKVEVPEATDIQELRQKEAGVLGSYAYTDDSQKTVRVPVDRAMQLIVEEAATGKLQYAMKPYPAGTSLTPVPGGNNADGGAKPAAGQAAPASAPAAAGK